MDGPFFTGTILSVAIDNHVITSLNIEKNITLISTQQNAQNICSDMKTASITLPGKPQGEQEKVDIKMTNVKEM